MSSSSALGPRVWVALGVRHLLVHGTNLTVLLVLGRLLSPASFGLFGVALFLIGLLTTCGGLGLGAALVRHPTTPQRRDEDAVFTSVLLFVGLLAAAVWLLAPALTAFYGMPGDAAWLLRGAVLAACGAPFLTPAVARLERRLAFARVALIEGLPVLASGIALIALAWRGASLGTLGGALAARGLLGALLALALGDFRPRLGLDPVRLRALFGFALPFHGATLVALARDALTPVVVGALCGATGIGYVNWAQTLAALPVWGVMLFERAFLPGLARFQGQPEALRDQFERLLVGAHALVAPVALLTLGLSPLITQIGFGPAWEPVLPLFWLLWLANPLVATSTLALSLLNARGRSRVPLGFGIAWTLSMWTLGPLLIARFGPLGYGLANLALQGSNLLLFARARELVDFRLWPLLWPLWAWAGAVSAGVAGAAWLWPPAGLAALAGYLTTGFLVYACGLAVRPPRLPWN